MAARRALDAPARGDQGHAREVEPARRGLVGARGFARALAQRLHGRLGHRREDRRQRPGEGRRPPPPLVERDDAAGADPDIAALWQRIQDDFYANQRSIVDALEAKGALAPGLDAARAADLLWTLNHPDLWHLLVGGRGWTPDAYEQWFGDTACAQLLGR